jgi:xanthine dehydrogenase YagS FAD-binding subunit
MRPFSYVRAGDAGTAIALVRARPDSAFLAGGTTEVDLVRQDVLRPGLLVDINDLPLDLIEDLPDGGLRIGALARPGVVSSPRPLTDGHPTRCLWESNVPKTIVITGPAIRVVPREAGI